MSVISRLTAGMNRALLRRQEQPFDCLEGVSEAELVAAARALDGGDDGPATALVDQVVAAQGEDHGRCAALAVLQYASVTLPGEGS